MGIKSDDFKSFEDKYKDRIRKEFNEQQASPSSTPSSMSYDSTNPGATTQSRQYQTFKEQWMPPHLSWYEKGCAIAEKFLNIKPDKVEAISTQKAIDTCHLNVTPTGVKSFSFFLPLVLIMTVAFLALLIPLALGGQGEMFFVVFAIIIGLVLIVPLGKMPEFFANEWRMKASNQMVLCVFYIVTYMRHTSNLENAINFAAEHLPAPLSIDLKKIVWNVETQRYSSVKESLDAYLETWKEWNPEFIESIHMIESSLYENSESRRLSSLDKSLNIILDETYEKMLHYAHNLQNPLTMLNMLGIVLPILGLVILPLVVSFMEQVKWYHILALYNIVLPGAVYYLGKMILSSRPTGYGATDISEENPEFKKHKYVNFKFGSTEYKLHPIFIAVSVFFILFFLGLFPVIMHVLAPNTDLVITSDYLPAVVHTPLSAEEKQNIKFYFLGYRLDKNGDEQGPFGLGAAIFSLFIPLSFGISIGIYYRIRSQAVLKIREETAKLEQEFAAALFQLGNRLGDGLPTEIAFTRVAETMDGTTSGKFFELVSINITKLGMSVEGAIFDPKHGAIVYYPSSVIESSMKVLVESSKKGPLVASQALINVSEYIKQIHRVDERLKDLMADTISSLNSQIAFLSPAIAGIVIGITSMITTILGNLSEQMAALAASSGDVGGGGMSNGMLELFGIGVPTYYFQIVVGVYVVQIIYIMTIVVNGIQNGLDPLNEEYLLGQNLINSVLLYVIIALIVMLLFNVIASVVLAGVNLSPT